MTEQEWIGYRNSVLSGYHSAKFRFDIELSNPSMMLREVPVDRNPHSLGGYDAWDCFYISPYWSTIFDWTKINDRNPRMIIECAHPDPVFGEKVVFFGTSSMIYEEWGDSNIPNKFAFFQNRFWAVKKWNYLHENIDRQNHYHIFLYNNTSKELPEIMPYIRWGEEPIELKKFKYNKKIIDVDGDTDLAAFANNILDDPNDISTILILSDYLEERGEPIAELIRYGANHPRPITKRQYFAIKPTITQRKLRYRMNTAPTYDLFKQFILAEVG
jgi:uncharacterized protein (TIGR02996 family)